MEPFVCPSKICRWWLRALPVGLLVLLLGAVAGAQQNLNTFNVGSGTPGDNNTEPMVDYLTPINATNFFNDTSSTFSFQLDPGASSWIDDLYEGWHYTRNFTNNGEMDSLTGFRFDTQISSHIEASSFYNVGNINCGTSSDAVFLQQYLDSYSGNYYGGYGGAYVWATNIYNSGTIAVGYDGLARLMGDNLDFTYGTVFMNNNGSVINGYVSATGQADIYTNIWNPANNLKDTSAIGPMSGTPNVLSLSSSLPYFQKQKVNATNFIVRVIFVQDSSGANVSNNIYFQAANGGFANVEWVGTYNDPASGQPITSYLYLNDDMLGGGSTNILKYGDPGVGVPNNFSFTSQNTPANLGAATISSSVVGLFPPNIGNITGNIYSYVDAQLIPTTVSFNGTGIKYGSASIALTNVPGRVEITAAKSLDLTNSIIAGMNYLLLKSTNEYDNDGSAQVTSPYYDIFLGRTNGSMVISNLVPSLAAQWSGTVQAWDTRWVATDTNTGITYDFRVMLVNSQVSPTTSPLVQNIALYSSNNVVISDTLNIFNSFSLNCTNLLLTSNTTGIGNNGSSNGSDSPDGELNLDSATISWATSTPRLSCLTNLGVISTFTSATFGSAATPYLALYNANSILNSGGTAINSKDFENFGTFDAGTGAFTVQSLATTMSNAYVYATSGTFSDTASNLVIVGTYIDAGKSLTLTATNLLTDDGVFYGNYLTLGANYTGYSTGAGLVLPTKPTYGDLLGSDIYVSAISGVKINNTWAGQDRSYSNTGFSNNVAIGLLELDAQAGNSKFYFTGTTNSNAIYVDCLQLWDFADTNYSVGSNLTALVFNTNLVIYYAQAFDAAGDSVAEAINGWNTNHLRWVPTYAGLFSSTSLDGTNNVNAALAVSPDIDSNGNGIPNNVDPNPFFYSSAVNFAGMLTNGSPQSMKLQWMTIPNATNYIYYKTNLLSPTWLPLTNFNNYYYSTNKAVAHAVQLNWFSSPPPLPGPATNVWIFDPLTNTPHFYRVVVQPWLNYPSTNPF